MQSRYRKAVRIGWIASGSIALALAFPAASVADDDDTLTASVDSMNAADLGRPVSSTFIPLTGKAGRTVFPNAKKPRKTVVNTWNSGFVQVTSDRTLRANASAWGLGSVDIGVDVDRRFLVFEVRVIEHTLELDDTSDARQLEANSTGAYYIRKIHFGRMYQIVISGSRDTFDAGLEKKIEMLGAKFGARYVQEKFKLSVSQSGKGLKPTSDALFATTPDEIKSAYRDKDMGPAVAVMAEYRRIPGANTAVPNRIEWEAPATTAANNSPGIHTRAVIVRAKNSDWTSTGLQIGPNDVIFGRADGNVSFSKWEPKASADASGSGGLELRIGTSPGPAGRSWMTDSNSKRPAGELKFRVRDNKHDDNSGEYTVIVFVIPQDMLMSDCQVVGPQGEVAQCPSMTSP
jgi:hypothetical protein